MEGLKRGDTNRTANVIFSSMGLEDRNVFGSKAYVNPIIPLITEDNTFDM